MFLFTAFDLFSSFSVLSAFVYLLVDLVLFFGEQDFNVDWQRAAATLLVAIGSHDPDLVYLLHNHYTFCSWINLL